MDHQWVRVKAILALWAGLLWRGAARRRHKVGQSKGKGLCLASTGTGVSFTIGSAPHYLLNYDLIEALRVIS